MTKGNKWWLNGGRGSGQTVRRITEIYEEKIADLKANFDYVLEGKENEYREERKKLCNDFENMKAGLESKIAELEKQVNDLKETNAILSESAAINQKDIEYKVSVIEQRNKKIAGLKQQIEKMKRHCNCKHRDSEGYCEVKRTYLMDLSYDGCDKWEIEEND